MAKIILRAGKVAIKIILPLLILCLIFYVVKAIIPAQADVGVVQETLDNEQLSILFEQAELFVDMGKHPQAEQVLEDIIQTYPETEYALDAQRRLTCMYVFSGNSELAETNYQELVDNFSEYAGIERAICDVADAYRARNLHPQKAIEIYRYLLDTWSESDQAIWAQSGLIQSYITQRDEAGAQAAIEELLTGYPQNENKPEIAIYIANDYWHSNPQALELFEYAINTWPDNKDAIWARAGQIRANIALGNYFDVPEAVDELLKQFSESELIAEAVLSIADNYYDVRKYENSLELYEYIMNTWPDDKDAVRAGAGIIRSNIGLGNELDVPGAINELHTQFSGNEYIAEAVFNIAGSYYDVKKHEEALVLYQYILNTFPDCRDEDVVRARTGIIRTNIALGDETNTQQELDQLVAEFSNSPGLPEELCIIGEDYGVKGYEAKSQGLETQAEEYFQKAVSVWERVIHEFPACEFVARAYYCSAGCYELELSEYEKAIEYYQQVLDNWSYFDYKRASYSQFGIARCYENLGKSGKISQEEAATRINQACNNLIANYPETNPVIIQTARKFLDGNQVSE
ncbi:MAG: tetratricopeptide repeat protein [Planctomycetota bacterium]|jgi:tetratricopeptide (TPR) repeat protein